MNVVLDANAMIDYLRGEPAGKIVRYQLEDVNITAYAHSINLIEVFYEYSRGGDVMTARAALETLRGDGIATRDDLDGAFCEDAAQLKADWKRVSLADCCSGGLLRRRVGASPERRVPDDRPARTGKIAAGVARITFLR